MTKKKAEKNGENINEINGEVMGHEVRDLPDLVKTKKNAVGEITGSETKSARVVGAVIVQFKDGEELQTRTLHMNSPHFSKYKGEDINYINSRPVKDEIYKNLLKMIPFGSTIPLKKFPGREKDSRPFYVIDMDALGIE